MHAADISANEIRTASLIFALDEWSRIEYIGGDCAPSGESRWTNSSVENTPAHAQIDLASCAFLSQQGQWTAPRGMKTT